MLLSGRKAISIIRQAHPRVRLDIYGKYDPRYGEELNALVSKLKLQSHVFFHSWRTPWELRDIIQGADIGVVPYLQDAFMDLAISTKTFECAATGLPVVASRLGSITNLFSEDCISYVIPGNRLALAQGILALAIDPERQRHQSLAAYQAQQSCSGIVMAERYTTLISSLLNEPTPNSARTGRTLSPEEVSR